MRFGLLRVVAVFLILLVSSAFPRRACAQAATQTDTSSIRSFVDSSAKLIYNLAWPTATYRTYRLERIQPVRGGFDVTITLWGLSAFDDSDLWVRLVIPIRATGVGMPSVLDHNAILMAPFATTAALAQAATDLSRQYATENAAAAVPSNDAPPPGADAVCLVNPTSADITFYYRWGTAQWHKDTLPAGIQSVYYWSYSSAQTASPEFIVEYDEDPVTAGYQRRAYHLDRLHTSVAKPQCAEGKQYEFGYDAGMITVYAR